MSTIKDLYLKAKHILNEFGVEDSSFEGICFIEHCFGMNRQELIMYGDKEVNPEEEKEFLRKVKLRKNGEPLQYILGKWYFHGLPFYVGQGVLIPREDTEVLVNSVLDYIKDEKFYKIADLCSGSGAIAVSIAKFKKNSEVTAIELSKTAYNYLTKNILLNSVDRVICINDDIFNSYKNFNDEKFDVIVSNPPYVKTDEIKFLQREVQYEPSMALDGGDDGLYFYRKIVEFWTNKLKTGGLIAFEIGETQAESVKSVLSLRGYKDIKVIQDISGLDRIITALKC